MSIFYEKIKKICEENNKVAMFIDMDGTIVEYPVYQDADITINSKNLFINQEPVKVIIEELNEINKITNIDLYILTLAKSNIIVEEKKEWLKKNISFIEENNWIIVNKEQGEYNKENRDYIKGNKIKEKLKEYDYAILLDDDHKILKQTQQELGEKCKVFHISSAII